MTCCASKGSSNRGPDARQILVRVRAASVNPVDFKIRSGKYPSVKGDRLPYTPGRDVSGIVETCGAQATRFQPGDAVFGMVPVFGGGYAERAGFQLVTWPSRSSM
ncbi:alcohol dehydrogenase catalytic domain-containing protein [Bradyrhizobium japonicum]|nr:alcohol dehydrogenase catalytic domain-containing protein [Bradyrhizobium japonicum]